MEVVVKQVEGLTFVAKGDSNHWVAMDGTLEFGGAEAGSRPKELVLMALAGCTAMDVASLLKKMRVVVRRFEIQVRSEQATEHPKVFTQIALTYQFWGTELDKQRRKIEKAINLSQDRYCPVSAMLQQAGIPITHTYEVLS